MDTSPAAAPTALRIHFLRAMYAFIAIGLGFAVWLDIVFFAQQTVDVKTVVRSLLGAVGLLAVLGVWQPLKMLPLLFFELAWKLIWVLAFVVPLWLGPGLDAYAVATFWECLLGLVLLPLVIPWRHVWHTYRPGAA